VSTTDTFKEENEMRKVTREVGQAFLNRDSKRVSNTETDGQSVWLHGHRIAQYNKYGQIEVNFCGWPTATTKDRINGIEELMRGTRSYHTVNGQLMRNGVPVEPRGWEVL
jgi:hypothetical protein